MGIMYRCSLGGGGETCEFIAPDYDANKTDYAADDVVLKDGKVMKYNGSEWEDFSLAECTTLNSNLGKVPFSVNKCNMEKYANLLGLIDITFTGNVYLMTFDVTKVRGKTLAWSRNTTGDGVYITITSTQIAILDGNYPYSSSSSSGSYTIPSNASGPYVIWSVNVAGTTDTLETINLSI